MNRIIFLFLTIIFVSSCTEKIVNKNSSVKEIVFDYNDCVESFDLGELLDGPFQIIPLETTDDCLIAEIDKIEIRNNRIFVMDRQAKSIFIFDMNGKFLNKIHAVGQGPGEYTNPSYMTVTDSSIVVIDHYVGKQIKYDPVSLRVLQDERLLDKIWCNELFALNGNIYYMNESRLNSGNFRLFKINGLNEINKYLPFDKESVGVSAEGPLYAVNGNEASIIYENNDTIFRINKNDEVYPEYAVKFKHKKIVYTSDEYNDVISTYINCPPGYIRGMEKINESDEYLFFDVNVSAQKDKPKVSGNYNLYTCIYNKHENKTTIYPNETFNGKLDSDFYFNVNRIIDNKLITWHNSQALLYYKEFLDSKKTFKNKAYENRLKNVIANLKEDDNPVLFIYNFK